MQKLIVFRSLLLLIPVCLLLTACGGDRRGVVNEDFENYDFVNKNFQGNKYNFTPGQSIFQQLTAEQMASLYGVTVDQVVVDDPTTSGRYQGPSPTFCNYYLLIGEEMFYPKGSIMIIVEKEEGETVDASNTMTRQENWQESWMLEKSMYKSGEWIPKVGMAALWQGKDQELKVKFDGYELRVRPPQSRLNEVEKAANRDYKKIALEMARIAGFIE